MQLWRPQEGGVELLYNSAGTGSQLVWRPDQLETRCGRESQHPAEGAWGPPIEQLQLGIRPVGEQTSWEKMLVWRTCPREAWPPGPRLSSPGERKRNAVMANRVGVNMLQFCSVSNSLSHTTFQIKWEVYFSKELCRSYLLWCRYDSACICRCICIICIVGHGHSYTTKAALLKNWLCVTSFPWWSEWTKTYLQINMYCTL